MVVKGPRALALMEAVIDALKPYFPSGVRTVRVQLTPYNALQIWAVPSSVPDELSYDFHAITWSDTGFEGEARGVELWSGVGTWLPLIPRKLQLRLAIIVALESVRSAVGVVVPEWPLTRAVARAHVGNDGAVGWFEDGSGRQLTPRLAIMPYPDSGF